MSRRLVVKMESMIWRYRSCIAVALTVVLLLVALQGYSGSRAWRLGPPFGATMDHDFPAVLRAARAIQAGDNPHTPALALGHSPSFQQSPTWAVAPSPHPPLVAIVARPFTALEPEFALKLWSAVNLVLIVGGALVAALVFADNRSPQFATRSLSILTLLFSWAYADRPIACPAGHSSSTPDSLHVSLPS